MPTVDWIILIIIALYALYGLRRGFVRTVVSAVGSLASFFGAAYVATQLKEEVGAVIAPMLSDSVAEKLAENGGTTVSGMWDSTSGYLQNILTQNGASLEILEASEDPQQLLADTIASSIAETIAYLVVFFIAFLAIKCLVHVIAAALGVFASLPILHSFDALLGGILGAATGLIICTCVLWVLKLVVPAMYSDYGQLSPAVMQQSSIARHLVGWNDDGMSLFEEA